MKRHVERYGDPRHERAKDPLEILISRERGTCAGCSDLIKQEWGGASKFVCRRGKQKGSSEILEMRRCRDYLETRRSIVGVKEKIVNAAQSKDLAWEADFEKAIDRLTAFGMSDSLGAALWRFKYLRDRAASKRAFCLLLDKAAARLKRDKDGDYLKNMVAGVMREWMMENCDKCFGTGLVPPPGAASRAVKCTKCDGTGLKRYSDFERSMNCGLKGIWNRGHQRIFDEVMTCLVGATAATGGRVAELLKNSSDML